MLIRWLLVGVCSFDCQESLGRNVDQLLTAFSGEKEPKEENVINVVYCFHSAEICTIFHLATAAMFSLLRPSYE